MAKSCPSPPPKGGGSKSTGSGGGKSGSTSKGVEKRDTPRTGKPTGSGSAH